MLTKRDKGRAVNDQNELLPASLPLLISRAEARTLLQDAIVDGKALLLKRTPSDLREDTPKAQTLTSALKAWGKKATAAMTTCFGATGTTAIKSTSLSYTTLDKVKQRVRLRLRILQAALEHANQSQKTRSIAPSRKPRSAKTLRPKNDKDHTPNTGTLPQKLEHKYDFCISFAGEDRKHAERLTQLLTREGARVFYDFAEEHDLWGKDLYAHLQDVYQNRSRYCVMFTSKYYVQKAWPNLERGAAQARSLTQPEYILPINLDDTLVPGLLVTKGVMDIRRKTLKEIAQIALKKLREAYPRLKHLSPLRQPKTKAPRKRASSQSRGSGSSLFMLGDHFYRALRYREAGDVITVTIWPRDDAEELRLRELGQHAHSLTVRFARRRDSGRGRVQRVEYIEEEKRTQIVVILQRETFYRSPIALSHDGAAQLERQLRWLIFGEVPPNNERYLLTNIDTALAEQLNASVLKKLWVEWKGTRAEFLEASQILLGYLINELGILDQVTTIDVGPWKKQKLVVHVKGSRKNAYSTGPIKVDVSSELEVPVKTY